MFCPARGGAVGRVCGMIGPNAPKVIGGLRLRGRRQAHHRRPETRSHLTHPAGCSTHHVQSARTAPRRRQASRGAVPMARASGMAAWR
jgi:hypothetical protein